MVELEITQALKDLFKTEFKVDLTESNFYPIKTKKEFDGDFTVIIYPLLRYSNFKNPSDLAEYLGNYLLEKSAIIKEFNVIKGFLNLTINESYWKKYILNFDINNNNLENTKQKIVIEFSSPNTNKPLHLGHIRNNLLGVSLSNILKYTGNKVYRVSLLNDRGIHIMKTLYSWEHFFNFITPEQANKKGDHLVGDFYVKYEQELKKEIENLINEGYSKEEALEKSKILNETKRLLRKWERGNKIVLENWKTLNNWVIEGFEETYKELGVEFDKIYLESETYLHGKDIILKELSKGNLKINEDNAIYIDLSDVGLDKKILLRSDGTSVYITQDIGTAIERYKEYQFDKHIYVVGNEQNYHFKVLKEILKRFGYEWYDRLIHFSYGMVELPEGKMKSREGKVVDADDLIKEMYETAREKSAELGKLDDLPDEEREKIIKIIAMGAMKYFILKVDPLKNMMFNPKESIDFEGNTGPFIQYTYTRIRSLLRKAEGQGLNLSVETNYDKPLNKKEIQLIKELYAFNNVIEDAAKNLNPASIANYVYNLAKLFNSFYQEIPILKVENQEEKLFRLKLSKDVADVIKVSLMLLGIDVPERM